MQLLIYIINRDRTIIGFVGLVVNLLNRPIDGATVQRPKKCVRKKQIHVLFMSYDEIVF
jgi:hypothetical protein